MPELKGFYWHKEPVSVYQNNELPRNRSNKLISTVDRGISKPDLKIQALQRLINF